MWNSFTEIHKKRKCINTDRFILRLFSYAVSTTRAIQRYIISKTNIPETHAIKRTKRKSERKKQGMKGEQRKRRKESEERRNKANKDRDGQSLMQLN